MNNGAALGSAVHGAGRNHGGLSSASQHNTAPLGGQRPSQPALIANQRKQHATAASSMHTSLSVADGVSRSRSTN